MWPASSGYPVPEKRGNGMKSYSYKNDMEFLEVADQYIISDYIRKCLFSSLEWYMVMYHKYRFRYHVISVIGLVLPTLVIVLNDIQDFEGMRISCKVAISVVSAVVAVASGLGSLYKWHEKSVRYRNCAEQLKCETVYYMAGIGDYSEESMRDRNFLKKIEKITLKEKKRWSELELQRQGEENQIEQSDDVDTDKDSMMGEFEDGQEAGCERTDCEEADCEETDCEETGCEEVYEKEGEIVLPGQEREEKYERKQKDYSRYDRF